MKTKTYFAFRIDVWDSAGNSLTEHLGGLDDYAMAVAADVWDSAGNSLTEHLGGLDDYAMAVAAYWAAIQNRPKDKITLRQGARVMMKNWNEAG